MCILQTFRDISILGILLLSYGCEKVEVSQQTREPALVEPILGAHRANLTKDFAQKRSEWRDPEIISTEGHMVQHSLFPTKIPVLDEAKTFRTSEADERYIIVHMRFGDTWIGQVFGLKYGTLQHYAALSEESLQGTIRADFSFSNEIELFDIE